MLQKHRSKTIHIDSCVEAYIKLATTPLKIIQPKSSLRQHHARRIHYLSICYKSSLAANLPQLGPKTLCGEQLAWVPLRQQHADSISSEEPCIHTRPRNAIHWHDCVSQKTSHQKNPRLKNQTQTEEYMTRTHFNECLFWKQHQSMGTHSHRGPCGDDAVMMMGLDKSLKQAQRSILKEAYKE